MKQYFSVQFPLLTQKWQEDILLKRFQIARQLYNELMTITRKRHLEMKRTKKYREAYLIEDTKEKKKVYQDLYKQYRLSQYHFQNDMTRLYKIYSHHIDSSTAGQIAIRVWQAHERCLFKDGKRLNYRKEIRSLTSGNNRAGITIRDQKVRWKGLQIPVQIKGTQYEQAALQNPIVRNTIVYRKNKFYIQILFQNLPFLKYRPGNGNVGIFIKVSNLYIATEEKTYHWKLPSRRDESEKRIKELTQRMERSRRATNPKNYLSDGRIKKGKLHWHYSEKYKRMRKQLTDLCDTEKGYLQQEYYKLVNEVVKLGSHFAIGKLEYAEMKKKREVEERKRQIENKQKRRMLQGYAPSLFLEMLKVKLSYYENTSFVLVPKELYKDGIGEKGSDSKNIAERCREYLLTP